MPVESQNQTQFWKLLCDQENIASHLVSLSTDYPDGIQYELPNFGKVLVRTAPASALGDNFMSDTFSVTAQLPPGNPDGDFLIFKTFIKVLLRLNNDQLIKLDL